MTISGKYLKAHKSLFREYSEKFPVIAQREVIEANDRVSVLSHDISRLLVLF